MTGEEQVKAWLLANSYMSLEEWGLDSDYYLIDGEWQDETGSPVSLMECAYYAMEASRS